MKPSFQSPSRFLSVFSLLFSAGILFGYTMPIQAAGNRQTMAQSIVNGNEYRNKLAHDYYQKYLGRAAQPAEVNVIANQMKTEGWLAPILALVSSEEYFKIAGNTNVKFVSRLFHDLVGRAPDPIHEVPAAVDFLRPRFLGYLEGSRLDLAKTLTDHGQFKINMVQSYYQKLLGRAATKAEATEGADQLDTGGLDSFIVSLVSSEEYFRSKGKNNNSIWLNEVSQDLLGRPARPGGGTPPPSSPPSATLPAILPASPPGAISPPTLTSGSNARLPIVQALITSPEYLTNVVNGYYQRFLHRQANPSELNYWLGSLQAGGSSDQVIVGILVSDEYFIDV
ncbi:MAG: DUF4214 domain-containing protein [Armatimonadota bacterium]|nr:DUF4214 domain-containing protein [Armatimonadota bacterium]